jgi:hypothetical protein
MDGEPGWVPPEVDVKREHRPRLILRFFGGFGLVDPGLVYIPLWRPDPGAHVSADPGKFWVLAGAGRKP